MKLNSPAASALRPRWVVAGVFAAAALIWAVSLYSMASQIGHPFSGFFYTSDRIVSSFTPDDFTGPRAGLQPWDRIVAVNGQHWREMAGLVSEAGFGGTVVYTVERSGKTLDIAVPTMEFTPDILWRFVPAYLLFGLLALVLSVVVYLQRPTSLLNCYQACYLFSMSLFLAVSWEFYLSQLKWTTYVFCSVGTITTAAGWILFWSFPADAARKEFLARWPLIQAYVIMAAVACVYFPLLFFLASALDQPVLWQVYTFSFTWGVFVIFGLGSLLNKTFPVLRIALRKSVSPLIRSQARVLLVGVGPGLGGYVVFAWAPMCLYVKPPANPQWGALGFGVYLVAIVYAVLRYRLLDIRVIVRKGLVYSLLTAALTAVFVTLSLLIGYIFQALSGRQSLLVALFPALLVAFLFQPARSHVQTLIDRAFFRREYEIRQILASFSQELSTLHEKGEAERLVLNTATKVLGAEGAALWFSGEEQGAKAESGPGEGLPPGGVLAAWLEREGRPFVLDSEDYSAPAEELRRAQAALAVPLMVRQRLVGILTLMEKRSGDRYTGEDLGLLTTLAQSAALAVENACLHEESLAVLRQQVARATEAQEEERQRIARELHDGVGPALASLNIRLRTAHKLLEREHHPAAEEVAELAAEMRTSMEDIRRLIYDLRPAALDELGLTPALREYLARWQQEHARSVAFEAADGERLPPVVETTLFRIAQEALNNIAKHAQAQRVEVVLSCSDEWVTLQVVDDGRGFDPYAPRAASHVGLWSMQERVKQLGGRLEIESAPGAGTRLHVTIPKGDGHGTN